MLPKLVRDRIPEIIRNNNEVPKTHLAKDEEYWIRLKAKLLEEVNEFLEAETIEELVDISEVLNAINDFKGFTKEEIELLRINKKEKNGAFKERIVLDEIKK